MAGHKIGEQEKMMLVDGKQHMIKYVDNDGHWKDLGILNEAGCLPSSWGGYPEVIRVGKPNFVTYFKVSLVVKYGDGSGIQIHVTGKTKQEAIGAWNRRN